MTGITFTITFIIMAITATYSLYHICKPASKENKS